MNPTPEAYERAIAERDAAREALRKKEQEFEELEEGVAALARLLEAMLNGTITREQAIEEIRKAGT